MKDPVKKLLVEYYDKTLISLEELYILTFGRTYYSGVSTFMILVVVIAMDGCMRRGVPS